MKKRKHIKRVRRNITNMFSKLSVADFCDKETLFIVDDLQPLLVNFEMTKVLQNTAVIAVDQDPLGIQG